MRYAIIFLGLYTLLSLKLEGQEQRTLTDAQHRALLEIINTKLSEEEKLKNVGVEGIGSEALQFKEVHWYNAITFLFEKLWKNASTGNITIEKPGHNLVFVNGAGVLGFVDKITIPLPAKENVAYFVCKQTEAYWYGPFSARANYFWQEIPVYKHE